MFSPTCCYLHSVNRKPHLSQQQSLRRPDPEHGEMQQESQGDRMVTLGSNTTARSRSLSAVARWVFNPQD